MPRASNILVLANQTAASPELVAALEARGRHAGAVFTLVMPAGAGLGRGAREDAERRLQTALERLRAAGLAVEGRVAADDPFVAAIEAWDPLVFDEVVVGTLPGRVSKWLGINLPRRIEQHTGALVRHVEASREWAEPDAAGRPWLAGSPSLEPAP